MGNVRKRGENRIIEQQRSDKNYKTTKKIRRKIRYIFFIPSEENRIIEQQGTVNNRTLVFTIQVLRGMEKSQFAQLFLDPGRGSIIL